MCIRDSLYDAYTKTAEYPLGTSQEQVNHDILDQGYFINGYQVDLEGGHQIVTYSRYASIWDMPFWRWPWYAGMAVMGCLLVGTNLHFALTLRKKRRRLSPDVLPGDCSTPVYLVEDLASPCPVSYTHLDVYKRQPQHGAHAAQHHHHQDLDGHIEVKGGRVQHCNIMCIESARYPGKERGDGKGQYLEMCIRDRAPEDTAGCALRSSIRILSDFQGQMSYIIIDTNCESLLGLSGLSVVVNSDNLSRSSILGTQTVTTAEYRNVGKLAAAQSHNNIQVQRLTNGAGLLGSVENRDGLDSVRDSVDQVLGREGTVQANLYQTNLAALSEHPVNGLLDGVVYRTHSLSLIHIFPYPAGEEYLAFTFSSNVTKENLLRTGEAMVSYYIYDADAEDKYERNQGARFKVEPVTDEAVIAQLHEETPEIPQGATFVHIVEVLPLG